MLRLFFLTQISLIKYFPMVDGTGNVLSADVPDGQSQAQVASFRGHDPAHHVRPAESLVWAGGQSPCLPQASTTWLWPWHGCPHMQMPQKADPVPWAHATWNVNTACGQGLGTG